MAKLSDVYARPQANAFLADICENPDDDAPRLIFADWLDEHGDQARAEFIRAQIERERLPTWSLRHRQLLAREKELLDASGSAWLDTLGPLRNVTCDHRFRRGFVEHVTTRPDQYRHYSDELFARMPLRSLKFYQILMWEPPPGELARDPRLKRLRSLSLSNGDLGEEHLPAFLAAFESERLEELDLYCSGIGEQSLAALRAARLPRLRTLSLAGNHLGDRLFHLFAAPHQYALRELVLGGCELRTRDILELADWSGLAGLESLALPLNDLGSPPTLAALEQVVRAAGRSGLSALHLNCCNLSEAALGAIGRHLIGRLTTLSLGEARVTPGGLRALLQGGDAVRLRELDLDRNQLGGEGVAILAGWPGLAGVKALALDSTGMNASAFVSLFTSPHLGAPVELSFRNSDPDAAGIQAIADCPRLGELFALDLNYCRLGNRRVAPLLDSPNLPRLRELKAHDNQIRTPMRAMLKERFPHAAI